MENPAFDVTPADYVAAIVTEKGIARAPYEESLRNSLGGKRKCIRSAVTPLISPTLASTAPSPAHVL